MAFYSPGQLQLLAKRCPMPLGWHTRTNPKLMCCAVHLAQIRNTHRFLFCKNIMSRTNSNMHRLYGSSHEAFCTHTVQHWLHWAMVWLQEGESLVLCSPTKAATIETTADAKVHRVLLHTVLLLCHLPELAGRRRRPSGLGGLATTRVVIWLRL